MEVVATTPLIVEVITPDVAVSVLLLIRLVEVDTPFMMEVIVLTAEESEFELMKDPVVVAITPFVFEVRVKEFVVVATESV